MSCPLVTSEWDTFRKTEKGEYLESANQSGKDPHCNILESEIPFLTKVILELDISHENNVLNANTKATVCVITRLVGDSHTSLQWRVIECFDAMPISYRFRKRMSAEAHLSVCLCREGLHVR